MKSCLYRISLKLLSLLISATVSITAIWLLTLIYNSTTTGTLPTLHEVTPIVTLYAIAPSTISILILERLKISRLSYFLICSSIAVISFLLLLHLWGTLSEPFLQSLKQQTLNNFSRISQNPPIETHTSLSYTAWFVFITAGIVYSASYWLCNKRKG